MQQKKPRILFLLHSFFNRAGTEEHTKALVQGLGGFECAVAFPDGDKICLVEPGKDFTTFPANPLTFPLTPYRAPQTEQSLAQILVRFQPDIVHIQHFIYWPLSVIDQVRAYNKPVVVSFHDYYAITPQFTMQGADDPSETLSSEYSNRVFHADLTDYLTQRREFIRTSLSKVKHLIVPSSYLAWELYKVFPYDFRVIEHGIKPFTVEKPARMGNSLRFGYIGSLLPHKGWTALVKAFSELHKKYPSTRLRLFGGGEKLSGLKLDGITFHGVYENDDLPKILGKFDVGIVPSVFRETFSLTLSELWQAGLPVAVSNIGALGERVQDDINGKKFVPGDVADIVRTLTWFAENDSWKSWTIAPPRTLNAMIAEYEEFYESILSGAK